MRLQLVLVRPSSTNPDELLAGHEAGNVSMGRGGSFLGRRRTVGELSSHALGL